MSQYSQAWTLTRTRFIDAIQGLSTEQLNWRMHPGTLTIGEMAIHVAGVEIWFAGQLTDAKYDDFQERVRKASTDGSVNENPFPFAESEINLETCMRALQISGQWVSDIIEDPTEAILSKTLVSALGPVIDGAGAFARLAYHAGYHQGQVHMIRTHPNFPAN